MSSFSTFSVSFRVVFRAIFTLCCRLHAAPRSPALSHVIKKAAALKLVAA